MERPGVVSAEIAPPLDEQDPGIGPVMRDCMRQQAALEATADDHVVELPGEAHAAPLNSTA
jgi:hypothetical protein